MKENRRFLPFVLTVALVVIDQISKALVMKYIPLNTIYKRFFGDFLYICHVRNTGAAFSLGAGSSVFLRVLVFVVLPAALMAFMCYLIASKKSPLTNAQKWFVAGIAGGGIGTLIDRIFRFNEGVVDFISVKFYGIFGLERWPTFNISDSCVVVFVILFAISVIFSRDKEKKI
ncbi:MAG: signal peptidase II [Spirochaetales bacterium]|nr:signal peptidase II [Spirochaetales bacterium]MBO6048551.1 signal peptidase II [Spirochaetales bacterium]MBO7349841.1 signal peptidase II [Spirochaetales bacterium]MBP5756401.1 signal peptidase II [Spirochaetales bacterium]